MLFYLASLSRCLFFEEGSLGTDITHHPVSSAARITGGPSYPSGIYLCGFGVHPNSSYHGHTDNTLTAKSSSQAPHPEVF